MNEVRCECAWAKLETRRENTSNEKDIFKDIKYYIVITIKVDCVRYSAFPYHSTDCLPVHLTVRSELIVGEYVC